jgi:hypothetical protein
MSGPSDSPAATTAVTDAIRTTRFRHSQTVTASARISSGQPKNAVSSAEFGASTCPPDALPAIASRPNAR